MGKQYRISLADQEAKVVGEMAEYWGRTEADVIVEAFRGGILPVTQRYFSDRGINKPLSAGLPYKSICQAINQNLEKLERSRIPVNRLIEIRDGSQPTDLEIARLALAFGTTEAELERFITCSDKECEHAT